MKTMPLATQRQNSHPSVIISASTIFLLCHTHPGDRDGSTSLSALSDTVSIRTDQGSPQQTPEPFDGLLPSVNES